MSIGTESLTQHDVLAAAMSAGKDSQVALAKQVNQASSTISRWLSGASRPDEGSALRLAKLTGLPRPEVLRAFGYNPSELGLDDANPKPRRRSPKPDYDLRLLRVSEMLNQFAAEVRSMVSESQPHLNPLQDATTFGTKMDYLYQTTQMPRLVLVPLPSLRLPNMGDALRPAVA